MQHLRRHFLRTMRFLLLAAGSLPLLTACGAEKISGTYIGIAKAELTLDNTFNGYSSETLNDSGYDALAIVTQEDGDTAALRFGNTALLKNCELNAKIQRTSIDIEKGAMCEADIAGQSRTITIDYGTVSVGTSTTVEPYTEARIEIHGYSGDAQDKDLYILRFEGKLVK